MRFPGRDLLFVIVTAMMVVPLQLAFIPVLSMYARLAEWATALNVSLGCQGEDCAVNAKTFAGLWAAHTAFGLPLAIYLLRNYIVGLPHELIESARVDGASHLKIFTKIVVPLSVPALASFGIFSFSGCGTTSSSRSSSDPQTTSCCRSSYRNRSAPSKANWNDSTPAPSSQ